MASLLTRGALALTTRAAHQKTARILCGSAANSWRSDRKYHGSQNTHGSRNTKWGLAALTGATVGAAGVAWYLREEPHFCKEAEDAAAAAGAKRADLPTFRKSEISTHKTKKERIWVTYKQGVYDITEFLEGHPGGERILLAAGGSIEPYWNMYAVHKNSEVYEILEGLRVGNLHPDDMKVAGKEKKADDPYANDPERHPALNINSDKPFNAEPPGELLIDNYYTPDDLFFVRNHLPVPTVAENTYKLEVSGVGMRKPLNLSLPELKRKFKEHTVVAAIQCAGNRRRDMTQVKAVKGLSWGGTAISNGKFTGVKLCDVLTWAGVKEEDVEHVVLQGLDKDMTGVTYEASIPAETAFDPRKDVLLAYAMNDEPISVDHGAPLRVVVPGSAGARQVKWLGKIIVSMKESSSHWQQNDYKSFNSSTDWHNVDFSKAEAIQEYPIQSAICEPKPGSEVEGDDVTVRGYAWSGGGRGIIRVDVSIDGGSTWHVAELRQEKQRRHRQWAWTLWEAHVPVPEGQTAGEMDIVCKATDTSYNAQPESAESVWNLRGLLNNAWHRVKVNHIRE